MTPSIELYIDILSPFAYIAYYTLRHSPSFSSLPITYTPILLGGLIAQTGGTGPLFVRNKDSWIEAERSRLAASLSVPIYNGRPASFPAATIKAQRVLVYLATLGQKELITAADALYHAYWALGRNVNEDGVLREVLETCFGEERVEGILRESGMVNVKEGLKRNTAGAFERGAFGLPWFVVRDQGEEKGFWGVDRLGSVLLACGREGEAGRVGRAML